MSTEIFFVVAFVVAAVNAARPKELILETIVNNTMCPIKMHINDDPNRTPQQIRFLQCAEQPNRLCTEKHISVGCCKRRHDAYYTECVEVYDYVQVQYRDGAGAQQDIIRVPVGCSCHITEPIKATEPA